MTKDPLVSIVIPTHNEGAWVERTVSATLTHDDGFPIEIIVVDDGSTDGSCDFLRRVRLAKQAARSIRQNHLGIRHARNAGAAEGRGEYLVFLDAHVEPESGWLRAMLEMLSDPTVALAGCRIGDINNRSTVSHRPYLFVNESFGSGWASPASEDGPCESPCVPGGCVAVRRATFETLGRWDVGGSKWGVDDVEFSMRAWRMGYRCLMSPAGTIWHWFRDATERPVPAPWVEFDVNVLRCLLLHFSGRRLNAVLHGIKQRSSFAQSWHMFQQDPNYEAWCADMQSHFTRSEDWYFEKFSKEFEPFERRLDELLDDKEKQQREVNEMLRARSGASSVES